MFDTDDLKGIAFGIFMVVIFVATIILHIYYPLDSFTVVIRGLSLVLWGSITFFTALIYVMGTLTRIKHMMWDEFDRLILKIIITGFLMILIVLWNIPDWTKPALQLP